MLSPEGGTLLPRAAGGQLAAFDDVPTAISLVPDLDRPEIYCNDAYFDMIGVERATASYADVRVGALYHPDDHEAISGALGRLAGGEAPFVEVTARLRAKELRWRYYNIVSHLVPARRATTARLVSSFLDVDEAYQGRAAVEQAAGRLEMLGASGDVATFEWDDFGKQAYVEWSDTLTRLLGYEPGEIESTLETYMEHVHPADAAGLREALEALKANPDRLFDHEYRIVPRGRRELYVRGFGRIYEGAGGRTRFVGLVLNVDERRRAVLTAKDVRRELERFVYSVSHDFTVPVRHINYLGDALAESLVGKLDAGERELLARSRAAGDRLARMVDGLLDYARLRRLEGVDEVVDLNVVAREVAEIVGRDYPGRIDIASLPLVDGNPTLLQRLLYVLVDNAAKFSAEKPEPLVQVYTKHIGEGLSVVVEDNGVGFKQAYADELFGLFSRLHPEDAYDGLGVGLATAARIVRMYGGRIRGEAGDESGACFQFVLPGARMPAAAG